MTAGPLMEAASFAQPKAAVLMAQSYFNGIRVRSFILNGAPFLH
jgi:hypothetical protein